MPIVKIPSQQKKQEMEPTEQFNLGDLFKTLNIKGIKGDDGITPTKGKDYFTPPEQERLIQEIIARLRGIIKGTKGDKGDATIGIAGKDGLNGKDGRDADEQKIIDVVLSKIPKPKDGRNGRDTITPNFKALEGKIIETIKKLEGKKVKAEDVDGLENRLATLRSEVMRNYGGHGGTTRVIKTTLVSGSTYSLASPYPQRAELQVYIGGGRVFFENGDYTTVVGGGNRVTSITFLAGAAAAIAQGATINILGK